MSKMIGIVGEKGGLGKTSVAISTSGALQRLGYTVALIDCDGKQQSAARWAQRAEKKAGVPFFVEAATPKDFERGRFSEWTQDVVVFDLPGHRDEVIRPVVGLCDLLITPLAPSLESWQVGPLQFVIELLNAARRKVGKKPVALWVLMNNIDQHRSRRVPDLRESLKDTNVFSTVISKLPSIEEAILEGVLPIGPAFRNPTKQFCELALELESILKLRRKK